MKLWSRAGVAAASAVVAAALVITGCSSSDHGATKGGSTTPANVDAANAVKQAADAMRKVTGMHVSLTVQGAVTNLAVTKLDGDVSSTPQTVATGTATLTVGKKNVDSKFVFVDGHLYSDVADPGKYADLATARRSMTFRRSSTRTRAWPTCCPTSRTRRWPAASRSTASRPPRSPGRLHPTISRHWPERA